MNESIEFGTDYCQTGRKISLVEDLDGNRKEEKGGIVMTADICYFSFSFKDENKRD